MTLPLLLLPGLMCDGEVWADLLPPLQATGLLDQGVTIADHGWADDLGTMAAQVLASAPPRFALAGHSMGGRVALEIVRVAPQRVSHLGLFNTGALPRAGGDAGGRELDTRLALLRLALEDSVAAMAARWVQGMVAPQRLADDPALVRRIVAMLARQSPAHLAAQTRALLHRPDATAVLATLQMPVLLLSGQQDSFSPPAQHQQMLDALPPGAGELALIDQAGHMAPMEQPQAVAQAMARWLRR